MEVRLFAANVMERVMRRERAVRDCSNSREDIVSHYSEEFTEFIQAEQEVSCTFYYHRYTLD